MIKCGKQKGKDGKVANQCILFSKDGSKALGYFLYSKHGGQKGAKAAAHKREGAIQFFKQKHQGLLDALETFGAPAVLKYVLAGAADCEACQEVVKAHVTELLPAWLEKARGQGQGVDGPRQGDGGADQCVCPKCGATAAHKKGTPCNEMKCPKCGAAMQGQSAEKSEAEIAEEVEKAKKGKGWTPASLQKYWKAMGGSVTKCMEKVKGHVDDPAKFCAWLKDEVAGTTKWRGKKKKSFDETAQEALTMLQKDEKVDIDDIDLSELEAWLAGKADDADVETEPTDDVETEPAGDTEPEPASDAEPEPTKPEPEPEGSEEPVDFHTFLLREHARKRAGVLAMLGEEVEDGQGD